MRIESLVSERNTYFWPVVKKTCCEGGQTKKKVCPGVKKGGDGHNLLLYNEQLDMTQVSQLKYTQELRPNELYIIFYFQ